MRILVVVHGVPPAAPGGTEIYASALAQALARNDGDAVYLFGREADPMRPEYLVRRRRRGSVTLILVNNTFRQCVSFEDSYRSAAIRSIGASLLDELRPDIVHIQHLTCLSTDLIHEIADRGIPCLFTLNDYWLMCHRGQLLDMDGARCAGPGSNGCARCLGAVAGVPPALFRAGARLRQAAPAVSGILARAAKSMERATKTDQGAAGQRESARRSRHMGEVCSRVTLFQAPSRTLRNVFIEFGLDPARVIFREQGIDRTGFGVRQPAGGPLRLGFLGTLLPSKAPHILLEAFRKLPPRAATLCLYGSFAGYHGDDTYEARLRPLLDFSGVRLAGPIGRRQVPSVLGGLDVLVVPSIWIENAPFVIREAHAAGVPVVASNLGGMAEMVQHGRNGLLFEPGNPDELAQHLAGLARDRGQLERFRAAIRPPMSIEEDAAQLRTLYASLTTRRSTAASGARAAAPLAAVVLNYQTPEETFLAVQALGRSHRRIDQVFVVDNASGDGSAERLRSELPTARVLQTEANLGFPGGVNVGIRAAIAQGAELVLLVNSDVIVPPDAVEALETALVAHAGAGIAGPVVLSRAVPGQVASAGMAFSPMTGRMRHHRFGAPFESLRPEVATVHAVSGCAMLVRRAVFERAGLFADEYFFSFEDLDFCLRARACGFTTICVPAASVYHQGGATIGRRSPRRVYFGTRNQLLLASRHGAGLPGIARSAMIVGYNLAHVLRSRDARSFAAALAAVRGARDHWRGRYGPDAAPPA
jgi:GT2 family glycosyltransferase/glycosyltransferase involved in cell wall biosynthesis